MNKKGSKWNAAGLIGISLDLYLELSKQSQVLLSLKSVDKKMLTRRLWLDVCGWFLCDIFKWSGWNFLNTVLVSLAVPLDSSVCLWKQKSFQPWMLANWLQLTWFSINACCVCYDRLTHIYSTTNAGCSNQKEVELVFPTSPCRPGGHVSRRYGSW